MLVPSLFKVGLSKGRDDVPVYLMYLLLPVLPKIVPRKQIKLNRDHYEL